MSTELNKIIKKDIITSMKPIQTQEIQYINLIKDILRNGYEKPDRTGIGTIGVFNRQLKFDLSNNAFPILTCRKIKYKNAIEEFLFMMRGKINSHELERNGVNIWKGNTSKEFLINNKKDLLSEGELGEIYGFNFRNFGGDYQLYKDLDLRTGKDQVKDLLNDIKKNPNSRRLTMTTNNPSRNFNGVLDPCHGVWIQFHVLNGKLSLKMTQRSCDVILGLPINILFYSLMLITFSMITGLKPHELIIDLNDTHIYLNHIEKTENVLLKRSLYEEPTLHILKDVKSIENLECLSYDDFMVHNYESNKGVIYDMAI